MKKYLMPTLAMVLGLALGKAVVELKGNRKALELSKLEQTNRAGRGRESRVEDDWLRAYRQRRPHAVLSDRASKVVEDILLGKELNPIKSGTRIELAQMIYNAPEGDCEKLKAMLAQMEDDYLIRMLVARWAEVDLDIAIDLVAQGGPWGEVWSQEGLLINWAERHPEGLIKLALDDDGMPCHRADAFDIIGQQYPEKVVGVIQGMQGALGKEALHLFAGASFERPFLLMSWLEGLPLEEQKRYFDYLANSPSVVKVIAANMLRHNSEKTMKWVMQSQEQELISKFRREHQLLRKR